MSDETEKHIDVTATVQRTGGMTLFQAAGTLGIGSVLVLLIVPKMISRDDKNQTFIQTELIGTLRTNSTTQMEQTLALQKLSQSIEQQTESQRQQALAMNLFLPKVEESIMATRDLTARLKPLASKLDGVSDALMNRTEAVAEEAGQP